MMEEPELIMPRVLSPCSSGRRGRSSTSSSPEFEFWMVGNGNQTFPQPELLSADELFSDGVLLPLDLLQSHPSVDPSDQKVLETPAETEASGSDLAGDSARLSAAPAPAFSSSKRWKDIFKTNGDRRSSKGNIGNAENCSKGKEKKKEKKIGGGSGGGGHGLSAAELNINIWPFSRSRSAGNGGSRPRVSTGSTRKVSSAPCSRSNSSSESKSNRKWPSSPGRAGVHLGRSSPVWQVRPRSSVAGPAKTVAVTVNGDTAMKNVEKGPKKNLTEIRRKVLPSPVPAAGGPGTAKAKALTLNVPMCIGYRHHLSCRSDENGSLSVVADAGAGGEGGGADEGVRGGSLFNIRSLFTKRVH